MNIIKSEFKRSETLEEDVFNVIHSFSNITEESKYIHQSQIAEIVGIKKSKVVAILDDAEAICADETGRVFTNMWGVGYRIADGVREVVLERSKTFLRGHSHIQALARDCERATAYDWIDLIETNPKLAMLNQTIIQGMRTCFAALRETSAMIKALRKDIEDESGINRLLSEAEGSVGKPDFKESGK